MLAQAQKIVLVEIIKSWLRPKSNFILVCPPMNAERSVVTFLTDDSSIYGIIGKELHTLALAKLDTPDFKSDLGFAECVAKCWDVEIDRRIANDAHAILEYSCEIVRNQGRSPIVIVHRFHEALDKLGEDIGTTLRNLEHSHGLKTVVTMPVSLAVLRERWAAMDPQKAPFLASDWGQGHSIKMLKGYSLGEIQLQGTQRGIDLTECEQLYRATGGLVDIVQALINEVSGKRGYGLQMYLKNRSPELCHRLLAWLDAKSVALTHTKSLISLLNPTFYPSDISYIKHHDWSSVLLGKEGTLNFEMLAWAAAVKMSKSQEHSLIDCLSRAVSSGNYDDAIAFIEILYSADQGNNTFWSILRDLTIFSKSTSDAFSNNGQWFIARKKINKLLTKVSADSPYSIFVPALEAWRPICEMLSEFFTSSSCTPDGRLERFICKKGKKEYLLPFLQLLYLRLNSTKNLGGFNSLQAILTAPESLLQVYAYFECNICFWNFSNESEDLLEKLKRLTRQDYRINFSVLGYCDLAYLVFLHEEQDDISMRLIPNAEGLDKILSMYEVRKDHAHSVSFTDDSTLKEYRDFFSQLLNHYVFKLKKSRDIELPSANDCIRSLLEFSPKSAV